ncbi:hypothetical protein FISHEDRAFT_78455 [Fistulina hepatica ATCC 64428]|nr:hypothetical protein FISHEDRAFT_78455 [Fistulina hepatica ATCC 64428]
MSSAGATAQDSSWKDKEASAEAQYIHAKEQAQLAAIRKSMVQESTSASASRDRDFEGGFGGQETLEDRYATTSGEH